MIDFVGLHNYTHYSLYSSLMSPKDLLKKAKELGQKSIAITDSGSLAGAWEGLKASREIGIKLIIGSDFYFSSDPSSEEKLRRIVLIAKNEIGYKNLLKILNLGFNNSRILLKKVIPILDWDIIENYSEGLICLTGDGNGILSSLINIKKMDQARTDATRLKAIFKDNLGIEIQANNLKRTENNYSGSIDQAFTNRMLLKIAKELDIRPVATIGGMYKNKEDSDAHDVFLAMGGGQIVNSNSRMKYEVPDFYIKTGEEVKNFFIRHNYSQGESNYSQGESLADILIQNSLYFDSLCENPEWIDPKYSNPSGKELPEFPVKDQSDYQQFLSWKNNNSMFSAPDRQEDEQYLRFWLEKEFNKRTFNDVEIYKNRIFEELDVLEYHGFSSYMLIVADFLQWCRNNNYRIGLGRGSVGGSLVAYLLDIHVVDPIKYDLIFSRFHNKEKTSFPDIDNDITPKGRDHLKDYIRQKYGHDNVAHVSNVNTFTAKVYARAIARTFMYGGDRKAAVTIGTNIADMIPGNVKSPVAALESAPLYSEYANKKYTELKKYAAALSGKPVAWSTHAGGVIIGKRKLSEIVPLRIDQHNNVALELDKDRAEDNGLVKIDILGVETLDIIEQTYSIIKSLGKTPPPDPINFEEYDQKTYDLISAGDTFCVFQLGTSGSAMDMCRKVQPKSVEDLAIINALIRPSSKDIRKAFVMTRNGDIPVKLPHPTLERAFGPTLGFGLYEESLLFTALDFAGWDLHKADGLRKLTKDKGKNPEKVKKLKEDFISGAVSKGIEEKIATDLWEETIEKFGGYGFNKSHAMFYGILGYWTAYLKAHFPLEFLVANLMSEVNSNAKIAADNILKIKEEIRRLNVKIIPPNINQSNLTYKIIDDGTLITGLDALKYIGKDSIPEILEKRPFTSFDDFLSKVDGRKVRSNAVQALAASGCLDDFKLPRKTMYCYASDFKKKLTVHLKKNKVETFKYSWVEESEWSIPELFSMEKYYLGEGLTGNKFQIYGNFFKKTDHIFTQFEKDLPAPPPDMDDADLKKYRKPVKTVKGEVKSIFEFKVKKEDSKIFGQVMAKIVLEDPWGNQLGMTCFPDGWLALNERLKVSLGSGAKLEPGMCLSVNGNLGWYDGNISLTFDQLCAACSNPEEPKDQESKKVTMKVKKEFASEQGSAIMEDADRNLILEEIEDELTISGFNELEDD